MKYKHKALHYLSVCLLLIPCAVQAQAADIAPPAALYPSEVRAAEENGVYYLEKVYYLSSADAPGAIPTADFEREGRTYSLQDILKQDLTETDSKKHMETITLNTNTDELGDILKELEPALEIATDDGYTGVLTPDYTSIEIKPAGYKTASKTITAERSYPNLSDADLSLIPKTITENGRTLTLQGVDWQETRATPINSESPGIRYNAAATYTGTATSKYVTGYVVTADYTGELTKTSCDSIMYTAVFASHGETQFGQDAETPYKRPWLVIIPLAGIFLAGTGYCGWRLSRHVRDKKRGYVK